MAQPILEDVNIVVLAKSHNPSIATKDWLHSRKIISERETNFVHTFAVSLFESESFSLLVDQNRLQVGLRKLTREAVPSLAKVVKAYVAALPETPYHALGYNLRWKLDWTREQMSAVLRKLFVGDEAFLRRLLGDDIEAGGLIHVPAGDGNLTIRIAPRWEGADSEGATAQFNFRYTVSNVPEIQEHLKDFTAAFRRANRLVRELQKYGGQQ